MRICFRFGIPFCDYAFIIIGDVLSAHRRNIFFGLSGRFSRAEGGCQDRVEHERTAAFIGLDRPHRACHRHNHPSLGADRPACRVPIPAKGQSLNGTLSGSTLLFARHCSRRVAHAISHSVWTKKGAKNRRRTGQPARPENALIDFADHRPALHRTASSSRRRDLVWIS